MRLQVYEIRFVIKTYQGITVRFHSLIYSSRCLLNIIFKLKQ